MGWVVIDRGSLKFAGELDNSDGFDKWANTKGKAIIDQLASQKGFSLLGKQWAAKRELWTDLCKVAKSDVLAAAIQEEVGNFIPLLRTIVLELKNLPRTEGQRYVAAVPRFILSESSLLNITEHLQSAHDWERLKGGAELSSGNTFSHS